MALFSTHRIIYYSILCGGNKQLRKITLHNDGFCSEPKTPCFITVFGRWQINYSSPNIKVSINQVIHPTSPFLHLEYTERKLHLLDQKSCVGKGSKYQLIMSTGHFNRVQISPSAGEHVKRSLRP